MENHVLTQNAGFKVIDWNRAEAHAAGMSDSELHYAILDCKKTADIGMPRDAGYYMDLVYVYRAEQARRRGAQVAPQIIGC